METLNERYHKVQFTDRFALGRGKAGITIALADALSAKKLPMSRQILTHKAIAIILSLAALSQTGCSKAVVENNSQAPSETSRAAGDRVVEIDRLLSAPLTGTPEDSDRRATLRAERVGLTGISDPAHLMRSQPSVARVANEPPRNTSIVVARDSRGSHEPHQLSGVEAMTPSERKRYYEELRLRNTHVVVPVVVDRRY